CATLLCFCGHPPQYFFEQYYSDVRTLYTVAVNWYMTNRFRLCYLHCSIRPNRVPCTMRRRSPRRHAPAARAGSMAGKTPPSFHNGNSLSGIDSSVAILLVAILLPILVLSCLLEQMHAGDRRWINHC